MEPEGTWFQSAMAERNSSITATNRTNPRESRQNLLKAKRMDQAGLLRSKAASWSALASCWYWAFQSAYGMP